MKNKVKKINLLPGEYVKAQKERGIQILILSVLIVEVLGFIGGIVVLPKVEARKVQARLDEVSQELMDDSFTDVNQKIKKLDGVKLEVEEWNEKYQRIKKENFVSKGILESLLTRVPADVVVNILSISKSEEGQEKQINIQGTAREAIGVINYATLLEGIFGLGTTENEFFLDKEKNTYCYTISIRLPEEAAGDKRQEELLEITDEAEGGIAYEFNKK